MRATVIQPVGEKWMTAAEAARRGRMAEVTRLEALVTAVEENPWGNGPNTRVVVKDGEVECFHTSAEPSGDVDVAEVVRKARAAYAARGITENTPVQWWAYRSSSPNLGPLWQGSIGLVRAGTGISPVHVPVKSDRKTLAEMTADCYPPPLRVINAVLCDATGSAHGGVGKADWDYTGVAVFGDLCCAMGRWNEEGEGAFGWVSVWETVLAKVEILSGEEVATATITN